MKREVTLKFNAEWMSTINHPLTATVLINTEDASDFEILNWSDGLSNYGDEMTLEMWGGLADSVLDYASENGIPF